MEYLLQQYARATCAALVAGSARVSTGRQNR
jgi:hypothetical protein